MKSVRKEFKDIVKLVKRYVEVEREAEAEEVYLTKTKVHRLSLDGVYPQQKRGTRNKQSTVHKKSITSSALRSTLSKKEQLELIREKVLKCQKCKLYKTKKNFVFGDGDPEARLVFVGEAPGMEEDLQGLPFVGAAGRLLTKIIEAIDLQREDVYILNILKCRPPGNRNPLPSEIEACEAYLIEQLEVIRPTVICCLGTFAAQTLLKSQDPITELRGRFHDYQGAKLIPTFHPAYLLRNPSQKRQVWEDMKKIRDCLRYQA